jgi:hypothetical protein
MVRRRGFVAQKKGELSSPKVSLKLLSGGRKLWVGFQAALGKVRPFVFLFLRNTNWHYQFDDLESNK